MAQTVVVLKTHIWTKDLEGFVRKIIDDTNQCGVDFCILMHDEEGKVRAKVTDPSIYDRLICFTASDIREIYEEGFQSMWLSNHWILMWFFQQHPFYKYYWSIEYDVRISGHTGYLWAHNSPYDFLYTRGGYVRPRHKFIDHYQGLDSIPKKFGYLQLARYSNKALVWLDSNYKRGINGQDELITYSLIWASDLTRSNTFLHSLIRGTWTWMSEYASSNTLSHKTEESKIQPRLGIYHPIK